MKRIQLVLNSRIFGFSKTFWAATALTSSVLLSACSGGSGQANTVATRPDPVSEDNQITYNGPSAVDSDVINFNVEFWSKLAGDDRCGACHNDLVGQAPMFLRRDNINDAYQTTLGLDGGAILVDLQSPLLSRVVAKVNEGHNCWDSTQDPSFCGQVMTNLIENWASASGVEANEIVLTDPVIKTVGESKSFPTSSDLYESLVYTPVLYREAYGCVSCHNENTSLQQQPYLASDDVEVSYDAAKSRINLDNPASSRLVYRLRSEGHSCWSDNCENDAQIMEDAIQAFADAIEPTPIDEDLVVSGMLLLDDGVKANAAGRFENNAVALYDFQPQTIGRALDTSGEEPPLHLDFIGNVEWIGSWGVTFDGGRLQGNTVASDRVRDAIQLTGEYSLETWVVPYNVSQDGPARIVTYSGDATNHNFLLGQDLYDYRFASRDEFSDTGGLPYLSTDPADEVAQPSLQHVTVNFDPINGRSIYVDGQLVTSNTSAGTISSWASGYALAVGNEVDNSYPWQGAIRLLAIHNRVLSAEQIQANFEAGVGQKVFMLFNVSDLIGVPRSYVGFQVQQFDNYSYLFNEPFFISLDTDSAFSGSFDIEGLRIGMNGQEVAIGQTYANLNTTINLDGYVSSTQVPLSQLGAIVPVDKGADGDEFFLTFDRIGNESYVRPAELPPVPVDSAVDNLEQSDVGVRLFGEINATLAQLTQSDSSDSGLQGIYNTVEQQLPTGESLASFLPAHQTGVMQLSVAYCSDLVNNTTRRASYFPGFNFSANYATAFNLSGMPTSKPEYPGDDADLTAYNSALATYNAGVDTAYASSNVGLIAGPLMQALLADNIDSESGAALLTQPDPQDFRREMTKLIAELPSSVETPNAVIAACTAAFGSSVMLLQ